MFSARLDMAGTIAGAAAAEHDASVKRYKKALLYGTTKRTVRMQLLRTEI
jgi:hypothetical protein